TPRVLEQYKIYLNTETKIPVRPVNRTKAINLSFFLLFEIFQYAIKLGYLNDNPTLHIRLFKIPLNVRPRSLTPQERQTILEKSGPLRGSIELILRTGVQWSELGKKSHGSDE